jgi:hypothetical protein
MTHDSITPNASNDRSSDELDANDPLAALRTLPTSVEPERDLWPGIAARIAHPARRAPLRPLVRFAMAASLLAALALGWALAARLRPAPVVVEVPAPPAAPAEAGVARTAYAATGRELDAIRDELRSAIDAQSAQLPPATRQLVFENLATIDKAIAEIEKALAAAPTDVELARTYVVYRQRQIDLLRQANRAAARL